jgi:hypothetical protein
LLEGKEGEKDIEKSILYLAKEFDVKTVPQR